MYTAANVTTLADIAAKPRQLIASVLNAIASNPNVYRAAGLIKNDAGFDAQAQGPGLRTDVLNWNPIRGLTVNVSNDDPTQHAVPNRLGTYTLTTARNHRNTGISIMNLVSDLMAQDPMGAVARSYAAIFDEDEMSVAISQLQGLIALDANGDMTYRSTTKAFNVAAVTQGLQTMKTSKGKITTAIVNSAVHAQMQLQESTAFVPASKTNINFDTYAGLKLIIDDSLPVVSGIYTTVLCGDEIFRYGKGTPAIPVEFENDPSAGLGGGQRTLWFRTQYLLHPTGYSFTGDVASQGGATNAEWATANKWVRKADRKDIPLVFVKTPLVDTP